MSYRNLEIWQLARRLTAEIHRMTLTNLPKFEMYEEGSQIRRSMKSVRSNLVEGYGRRRYRLDYIRFLTYAQASCDETTDHLNILQETGSLQDDEVFESIAEHLDELGRKLNKFIQAVEQDRTSVREDGVLYGDAEVNEPWASGEGRSSSDENPASSIQHRASDDEGNDPSPSGENPESRDEYRATSIEHPTSDPNPEQRDDGELP
jgi:four helix bundle protein